MGQYEILDEIGRGGMGIVYRARDAHLGRTVALKVLAPPRAQAQKHVKRFLQEGRAAARVSHPNIVTVYDVGESGGTYFLTMELIEGKPLDRVLRETGRLPVHEALRIARDLADALAAAHREGVIHRDIKPQNIMVDPTGAVKVTDFGLARLFLGPSERLTVAGARLGTPAYMSPEQIRGEATDPRTDVFSLGVTLYEMLAGKRPYEAQEPLALMYQIVNEPVPRLVCPVAPAPSGVQKLVAAMMAKRPDDRPASAEQVRSMLDDLIEGKSDLPWLSAGDVPVEGQVLGESVASLWGRIKVARRRLLLLCGSAGIIAAAATGLYAGWGLMRDRASPGETSAHPGVFQRMRHFFPGRVIPGQSRGQDGAPSDVSHEVAMLQGPWIGKTQSGWLMLVFKEATVNWRSGNTGWRGRFEVDASTKPAQISVVLNRREGLDLGSRERFDISYPGIFEVRADDVTFAFPKPTPTDWMEGAPIIPTASEWSPGAPIPPFRRPSSFEPSDGVEVFTVHRFSPEIP